MSDHTKTQSTEKQWTMQEIYDLLMFEIEPELMSDMITLLPEIYKGETSEQHEERMERYREAFEVFYRRFDMLLALWKNELGVFKKEIMREFEAKVLRKEGKDISQIQQDIQNT